MDMCLFAIDTPDIKANLSFSIVGVGYLTHLPPIDTKEEIGTLGIHPQVIILASVVNALFTPFS